MRDREFISRVCALQLLSDDKYRGDMDEFLAEALTELNRMQRNKIFELSKNFYSGLRKNSCSLDATQLENILQIRNILMF